MPHRLPARSQSTHHALASSARRWQELPPAEGFARVLTCWETSRVHTEQTLARMSETVGRFIARLNAQGVTGLGEVTQRHVAGFVAAPTTDGSAPELATQHARRTSVRTFYRTLRELGVQAGDPTMDLRLPPRGVLAARPLTDDEVALGRVSSQVGPGARSQMQAVAWALAEATAVSSEITAITMAGLDDSAAPCRVALPGTRRHDPRQGQLTAWGAGVLRRRVAALAGAGGSGATLLAYGGAAPPGGAKAQASVCNALRAVLDTAGLAAESDVRPGSLRHWAGRRAYDEASIEAVARMLGHRSLDATAEDIALAWRDATTGEQVAR
jgi:site-specific recombinase XerC